MIPFIKFRSVWFTISTVLFVAALAGIVFRGIPYGIDFTGGTLIEVEYSKDVPAVEDLRSTLEQISESSADVQRVSSGYIIRLPVITEAQHRDILAALRSQIGQTSVAPTVVTGSPEGIDLGVVDVQIGSEGGKDENQLIERRYDTVGPVIGQELKRRSVEVSIVVLLAILAFIAWSFRQVSWPVKSWKYGVVAIVALFHDLVITLGAFVWLSSFFAWDVDTTFVAALLTILGYSVSDRIVVFDRVRENLPRMDLPFDEVVNVSINQTLIRSLSTGFTAILMMLSILFFGGETLRPFMFTLIIGVLLGTYSSIFIASPLLVTWQMRTARK